MAKIKSKNRLFWHEKLQKILGRSTCLSLYIYIYSEAQVDLAILRVLPQQEPGPVKSKIVFVGLERYVKEI